MPRKVLARHYNSVKIERSQQQLVLPHTNSVDVGTTKCTENKRKNKSGPITSLGSREMESLETTDPTVQPALRQARR